MIGLEGFQIKVRGAALFLVIFAAGLFFCVSESPEILNLEAEYIAETIPEPEILYAHDYFAVDFRGRDIIDALLESRMPQEKELADFILSGEIEGIITGKSVNEVFIYLLNMTDMRLTVKLPLGLYFTASRENIQDMVLTESMSVSIGAGGDVSFTARVACVNIYKDVPGDDILLMIDMLEKGGKFLELLNILRENNSVFEVTQAAIWILQDNPPEKVIAEALEYDDGERAVTGGHYEEAHRLVELVR